MELDEPTMDASFEPHFVAGEFHAAIRACEELELQARSSNLMNI
jgi:stage V sporulation protein SpoVS